LRFGMQVVDSAAQPQVEPSAPAPESRLLYIASDKTNWDQLFIKPLRGGAATQLTHEPTGITGYSLSPDYQTILYTLFGPEGGTSIWSLKVDGAERRRVLDCPRSECNAPHWYPDGQRLAYERLDEPTDAQVPRFSIWWLDLRTGATLPVFQDDSFASYAPQFSPDGEYLAYVSGADNTLVLFNLKDGSSRSIPRRLQAALPPSWSPDSSAVLYGSQGSDGDPLRAKLYVLATGESLDLGGSRDATDYSAVWSPSGAWIAINRNIRLGASINSNQVWLVRPDGTDARAFLQEPGASYSSISWSPDGSYILYSRYVLDLTASTPGRFDIYMTDAESGESELLVEGGDMPTLLP
jgi:TolB protein